MQIKTVYKFKRADGGTTVSPIKPEGEYTVLDRIIAGEEKAVTNDGATFHTVIDTDSADGYYETDRPEEEEELAATVET